MKSSAYRPGLIRKQGAARQVIGDYLALALPNQNRFVKLDHIPRHHLNENRVRLLSLEWLSDLPLQHTASQSEAEFSSVLSLR